MGSAAALTAVPIRSFDSLFAAFRLGGIHRAVRHPGALEVMKRTLAAVVLLAALGMFVKLAFKPGEVGPAGSSATGPVNNRPQADPEADLIARYPSSTDLVRRV